jgi:hypothetical protein
VTDKQVITAELDTKRLAALLELCNLKKPKAADIKELRALLARPGVVENIGGMVVQNINKILAGTLWAMGTTQELIKAEMSQMEKAMGYTDAPMLERILIDAVTLAWLRWQEWEYHYTGLNAGGDMTLTRAAFWEKRLSAAQARYLRAVETLAKVRKLARRDPALQLNVAIEGGQQVNVAGDLVKK